MPPITTGSRHTPIAMNSQRRNLRALRRFSSGLRGRFSFFGFPTGEVDGRLYLIYIGQQLKKLLPDVPSVQALKDKEVVFMMI